MRLFLLLVFMCFAASTFSNEIILTEKNTVVFREEFDSISCSKLTRDILTLDSQLPIGAPIYVYVDSPGGSITAGLELISSVGNLKRPVHTITSFAASMGFQLVQNLGHRYMLNSGTLMSHKATGGFEGEFGVDGSQLENRYNFWKSTILELDMKTISRTNGKQTLDSYRKAYENELWLNARQAIQQGYADSVFNGKCSTELLKKTDTQKVKFFIFEINVTRSRCPLVQGALDIQLAVEVKKKGKMTLQEFKSKGGVFGKCETEEKWFTPNRLCLVDETLTEEVLEKALVDFKAQKINKKSAVKSHF